MGLAPVDAVIGKLERQPPDPNRPAVRSLPEAAIARRDYNRREAVALADERHPTGASPVEMGQIHDDHSFTHCSSPSC